MQTASRCELYNADAEAMLAPAGTHASTSPVVAGLVGASMHPRTPEAVGLPFGRVAAICVAWPVRIGRLPEQVALAACVEPMHHLRLAACFIEA